jgi:hypothetical protein
MKLLLLAALSLLVACSDPTASTEKAATVQAPKIDPTHQAVSAYLHKTLDDPASYQPAEWGKAEVWTKAQEAQSEQDLVGVLSKLAWKENRLLAADSLAKIAAELRQITDTSRVGLRISHRYRKRDARGTLVFDSVTLLVSPTGKVLPYRELIRPDILALAHTL